MSSIFGQANPTGVSGYSTTTDTGTYAVWFTVAKAGTLTGIWYYSPATATTLPTTTAIYSTTALGTQTLLNSNTSPSWSGAAGSGWVQDTAFPSTALTSGTVYMAAYFINAVLQAFIFTGSSPAALFPSTSSDGNITAPESEFALMNGPFFNGGTSLSAPNATNGNNLNWLVDVQISFPSGSGLAVQPLPPFMFPPLSKSFGPNPPFEVQQPYPPPVAAAPSVPAPFFPPHSPLRGPAAAVKGKLASSTGRPGVPAPFRPPRVLLRGRSAAVKGTLARLTGRPGSPAPFTPPRGSLRGPAGARPGKLAGIVAPPPPVTPPPPPAPFRLPGLFRGRASARPGRLAGLVAPPPVITPPSVPSPFSPAFHMLRGARSAAPGRLTSWRVQTFAQLFAASGAWTAPGNLAAAPAVYAWGPSGTAAAGSGASSGGGAGAGAFGGEPALGGVTPGTVLTVTVGTGGSVTATTVTGGSVTVSANAGTNAASVIAGSGGAAGSNTLAEAGGSGGGGGITTDGGGGGGSAGSTGAGGTGTSGLLGGAAGAAGTGAAGLGGQPGGAGATAAAAAGNGNAPGGAPGGGGNITALSTSPGNAVAGQALIIWSVYVLPPVLSAVPAPMLAALSGAAPSASRAAPSVPAPFFPPHSPLRGAALAVKGKLAGLAGRRGVPSPFRLPGLFRGQAAARPGKLAGIVAPPPVLHPVITSPLTLPPFPLRGRALARPGALTGTRGRPGVPSSPFQPSHTVLRGQPAARKGITGGTVAPPPVAQPNVPAPFFPPHVLLRGQVPATSRTKTTGGIAPPPAPPPAHPPHWQGSTHMIAAGTPGNLIQGAGHTGKGGPGTDLKGDFQRSGD